jgi:hypothetical protein
VRARYRPDHRGCRTVRRGCAGRVRGSASGPAAAEEAARGPPSREHVVRAHAQARGRAFQV